MESNAYHCFRPQALHKQQMCILKMYSLNFYTADRTERRLSVSEKSKVASGLTI